MLDDMRFWMQVLRDQRRTIICSPELESRIKAMVDAFGVSGQITVKVNEAMPDDQVFVVDEQAIQAEMNRPIPFRDGGR